MDSINSWINEDEVRKLAEDLSATPEAAKEWKDSDYDGFAIPEEQGQAKVKIKVESKEEESNDASEQKDIAQEVKDIKSSSLAGASALAASAGLLGAAKTKVRMDTSDSSKDVKLVSEPVNEVVASVTPSTISAPAPVSANKIEAPGLESHEAVLPPLCDHSLNEVPINVKERVKQEFPSVHADKEIGTFEKIDEQLTKTVKANGICVIDRDGDVLYSSMKNQSLVRFTIDSMKESKLMRTQDNEFGNIRMKVSANNYLEFVSVHSTRGVIVLAILMDHILGGKNAKYVAGDALKIANMT